MSKILSLILLMWAACLTSTISAISAIAMCKSKQIRFIQSPKSQKQNVVTTSVFRRCNQVKKNVLMRGPFPNLMLVSDISIYAWYYKGLYIRMWWQQRVDIQFAFFKTEYAFSSAQWATSSSLKKRIIHQNQCQGCSAFIKYKISCAIITFRIHLNGKFAAEICSSTPTNKF